MNRKRPYIEIRTEEEQQKDVLKKLDFLICKSLKGNMSNSNFYKLVDIITTIDNDTATDEEIAESITKLYEKVK